MAKLQDEFIVILNIRVEYNLLSGIDAKMFSCSQTQISSPSRIIIVSLGLIDPGNIFFQRRIYPCFQSINANILCTEYIDR